MPGVFKKKGNQMSFINKYNANRILSDNSHKADKIVSMNNHLQNVLSIISSDKLKAYQLVFEGKSKRKDLSMIKQFFIFLLTNAGISLLLNLAFSIVENDKKITLEKANIILGVFWVIIALAIFTGLTYCVFVYCEENRVLKYKAILGEVTRELSNRKMSINPQ